jgi:carbon-monoxide dehydrogenase small subunit
MIRFQLNGEAISLDCEADEILLDVLREKLGLTGVKEGCGQGECGACTVIMDGVAVDSCLVLMNQVEGCDVTTIEGVKRNGKESAVQQAFVKEGSVQCGYCTPGMVLSAEALLDKNPNPDEKQIRTAIAGNLCRCTGYSKIVAGIQKAAQIRQKERNDDL